MLSSIDEQNQEVATLQNAGFDSELVNILMDEVPGALKHITNSIKDGSAKRIGNEISDVDKYSRGDVSMQNLVAMMLYNGKEDLT